MSPIYRAGDRVVFKYEGNVRATVEGYELAGGKVRVRCRAGPYFDHLPLDRISQIAALQAGTL